MLPPDGWRLGAGLYSPASNSLLGQSYFSSPEPSHRRTRTASALVFAKGDIYTNTVESAFSLLKRGIVGSWHRVSAKHLQAYSEEMAFRFNRRDKSDLFVDTCVIWLQLRYSLSKGLQHEQTKSKTNA